MVRSQYRFGNMFLISMDFLIVFFMKKIHFQLTFFLYKHL